MVLVFSFFFKLYNKSSLCILCGNRLYLCCLFLSFPKSSLGPAMLKHVLIAIIGGHRNNTTKYTLGILLRHCGVTAVCDVPQQQHPLYTPQYPYQPRKPEGAPRMFPDDHEQQHRHQHQHQYWRNKAVHTRKNTKAIPGIKPRNQAKKLNK